MPGANYGTMGRHGTSGTTLAGWAHARERKHQAAGRGPAATYTPGWGTTRM